MTKKNKKHIVIATAIIILVVALLIYRYYIPDMKPKKQFTPASVEYTYDDSVTSSQLAEYNARQDWQLTLVNNDTPICENCSVILTALDNGQAVDCRIYPQLQKCLMMHARRGYIQLSHHRSAPQRISRTYLRANMNTIRK